MTGRKDHRYMQTLTRDIGLPGAVVIGLGSILGTGVFVSIALAAEISGPAILPAVLLAGIMASLNGFSSAALAAAHPVSGGAYEYGYTFVSPAVGFTAGWMFLVAKSASAATAALGFAGYLWSAVGSRVGLELGDYRAPASTRLTVFTAIVLIAVLTALVSFGVRRSNRANAAIVAVTVATLVFFVAVSFGPAVRYAPEAFTRFMPSEGLPALLHATALVFVAFTGYGRIATLGEEVRDPGRTIPRAVVVTLSVTVVLYALIAFTGFAAVPPVEGGLQVSDEAVAPLAARAAAIVGRPGLIVVSLGAITAMAGVLLNLILGLSRVVLAMGRRGDLPALFNRLDRQGRTPIFAVWLVGFTVAALALLGDVRTTWSFSAFTVLIYYAITNLAALRIPEQRRIVPNWVPALGLVGCLAPAFFVEPLVWMSGLGLVAVGLIWHFVRAPYRR